MRVVVLVKYVPDITSDLRFSTDHRVVREAGSGTLNELDEHAVEAALQLVAAAPDVVVEKDTTMANATPADAPPDETTAGEVIAITMAPDHADLALRKAFQMGATRGIRLTDEALVDSDTFGTTQALTAAIRKLGDVEPIDVVVTGIASSDGATGVLAALIADELGWPLLSFADSVKLDGDAVTITRHPDEVVETFRADLPVVLSVTDAANTVRTPNFKLIMAARKAKIETWTLADLDIDADQVGAAGSRIAVVATTRIPAKPEAPRVFDDGAGSGARALVEFLTEKGLVNHE
ncbi:MAG: electron transfer flavoprotein subunit beta/FixA family protein [Promicromonosporaceae bacterium]|nr:electron transfer flavoprotein subunit beta/FixA family protein [Promicromonosporaceae bacterium]